MPSVTASLLSELESIIINGYTINGVKQLGTSQGELLTLLDFENDEVPFSVSVTKDATDAMEMAPVIIINNIRPTYEEITGGAERNIYVGEITLVFTDNYAKVVDGERVSGAELAQYFWDKFRAGIRQSIGQWESIRVSRIILTGEATMGRRENSAFYGFNTDIEIRFIT